MIRRSKRKESEPGADGAAAADAAAPKKAARRHSMTNVASSYSRVLYLGTLLSIELYYVHRRAPRPRVSPACFASTACFYVALQNLQHDPSIAAPLRRPRRAGAAGFCVGKRAGE